MNETQKKSITTSILVKSSFWYTISSYLTHAIGFITTPIFTRILSKSEFGDFSVYVNWQSILVMICSVEIYGTINRARFDYSEENEFNGYITSCLLCSTIVTSALFFLYIVFKDFFYRVTLVEHKHMIFMFFYAYTIPAFSMFQVKQRITYRYKLNAIISFSLVLSSSILAVILASIMVDNRLSGRIFGQFVLYIIAGAFFYLYFLRKQLSFNQKYVSYALKLAIPLVISHVASSFLMSSDNFVVKHMCTGEQVSFISLSHTFTNIILVLVRTLNGAWSPWYYDKLEEHNFDQIQKLLTVYIWFIIVGTFSALLLGPEIIAILGGDQYREAITLLPLVVLNGFFTVLISQFTYLETYHKETKYTGIITGIAAIFNVVLDIIGVKIFGYKAVCYATIITQILMIISHYVVTRRMEIKKILPIRQLIMYILVSILLIPISLISYKFLIIRIGCLIIVVLLIIILLCKNFNKIKQIIKQS